MKYKNKGVYVLKQSELSCQGIIKLALTPLVPKALLFLLVISFVTTAIKLSLSRSKEDKPMVKKYCIEATKTAIDNTTAFGTSIFASLALTA